MITKEDNWTNQRLLDYQTNGGSLEYVGNAFHYYSKFIKTSDINRRTRNPNNINSDLMKTKFGKPNFETDHCLWWILNFNDNVWVVDIHSYEGSGISRLYNDGENRSWDKQHSEEMGEFVKELYDILLG